MKENPRKPRKCESRVNAVSWPRFCSLAAPDRRQPAASQPRGSGSRVPGPGEPGWRAARPLDVMWEAGGVLPPTPLLLIGLKAQGGGGTGHPLVLRLCPGEGSAQHLPHGKPQKQKTGSHTLPLLRNSTTGRTRVKKASRWWPEPRGGRQRAPRGLGKF